MSKKEPVMQPGAPFDVDLEAVGFDADFEDVSSPSASQEPIEERDSAGVFSNRVGGK